MTSERWQKVEQLYLAARQKSGDEQVEFLDGACGADAELKRDVESLLRQDDKSVGFLDNPVVWAAAPFAPNSTSEELLGRGAHIGPYEILSMAGVGGMGQVYKARDTRLDRTVAVKVISPDLMHQPQSRERFEREARAVSRLIHPNICTLFDVGRENSVDFLVMEYLEGETLAARLTRGPLPLNDALKNAISIAGALDEAHRNGITHRDLKPANIMLTKAGPKLLDFGLARMDADSLRTVTRSGTIVGTLQYMAPEQIAGKPVDARTDIFAFGSMLYEMLSGHKAFEGENQTSLIAAILEAEPPALTQYVSTSPGLERVLKKCVNKEPDDRWQSIRDLKAELQWISEGVQTYARQVAAPRFSISSLILAAGGILAGFGLATMIPPFTSPARPVVQPEIQFEIKTPTPGDKLSFAISPDGKNLVFEGVDQGKDQLWLHPMASVESRPLPGTENGRAPCWSPDSRSIGFFAEGKFKRIDLAGDRVQTITNIQGHTEVQGQPGGCAWRADDVVLFGSYEGPLQSVPASGGAATPITHVPKPGQSGHVWPEWLPDGVHFIYFVDGPDDAQGIYLGSTHDGTVQGKLLSSDGWGHYSEGYLFFRNGPSLIAQQFDVNSFELRGEPRRVVQNLGNTGFSVSSEGAIAYRAATPRSSQLGWFDRRGRQLGKLLGGVHPHMYNLELSADDSRAAIAVLTPDHGVDIWLVDTLLGTDRPLTHIGSVNHPLWSHDGNRIAFTSCQTRCDVYQIPRDGSAAESSLVPPSSDSYAQDWSQDGRYILYRRLEKATGWDLWAKPTQGQETEFAVANSSNEERDGQFSPDGKWIAFLSNDTGRFELYVQRFPTGERFAVTSGGAAQPRWRGNELFYLTHDSMLMSVPIKVDATRMQPVIGKAVSLFPLHTAYGVGPSGQAKAHYAVSHDGQRFLVDLPAPNVAEPIYVILNWSPTSTPQPK